MKVIVMNEDLGLIWYKSFNYKYEEVHVVCYGLQVKQFNSREEAQQEFNNCLNHAFDCNQ